MVYKLLLQLRRGNFFGEIDMRRRDISEIIGILDSLSEYGQKIPEILLLNNQEVLTQFLTNCQNIAIAVGTRIEESEGLGTQAVSGLEQYCESLFEVLDGQQGAVERCDECIEKVKELVRKLRVNTEVVFLPYKASMWDSLESVWKEMKDNPHFDTYVVPIPYYDKGADGSFAELHYEGNDFPDYVPVVRYDSYDFEKRHPDKIYIHNPYDEYNNVTSVHPYFYSGKLKKLTDELIYIPYFVMREVERDAEGTREYIEPFCLLPGVINADQVILQSENIRQIFIDILTDRFEDSGMDRKYWEERIIGSGSPKIQKIRSMRKEDVFIPDEWMRIIQKPDGEWKKVIFYNTSVAAFLKHGSKMMEKIKDTLEIFKEYQNDVALLWRPHPLMQATIQAMRPEFWEEYSKIVNWYRDEGWGIYDDTADMDRALVLCDAYFGDNSSLIYLCKEIQKPVMLQNVEILNNIADRGSERK